MEQGRKATRPSFRSVGLGLLTATVVVLAMLNVRQLWVYRQPTDAVLWQPTTAGLEAAAIDRAAGPSSLRLGDRLVAINGQAVAGPGAVAQRLYAAGIGARLQYIVARGGKLAAVGVEVRPTHPALPRYAYLEIVGVLYLAIGLFVLYRRQRAPQALRFYLFCLASFVLFCFHYTGKLNAFDRTIFWGNEAGLLLAPCLLADFALRFRAVSAAAGGGLPRPVTRSLAALLYVPAVVLGLAQVAFATGAIWLPVSLSATQAVLDRGAYGLLAVYFILAAVLFARKGETRAEAMQARVMSWGTALGVGPFLALYLIPYLGGVDLPRFANLSVLSLVLIPMAFGYAIWRHHLLDAEVVLRRGVVYTLATMAVIAVYLGVIGLAGMLIHARMPTWGWSGWLLAILVTVLVFEPLKGWLQEGVDRLFYRERYDYRRTLIEFGRQMNAEPELERVLSLVMDRLVQTLSLARVGVFLVAGEGWRLNRGIGLEAEQGRELDLSFLNQRFPPAGAGQEDDNGSLVMEHPDGTARELELFYYLPCRLQGRTAAILGLGKTAAGEFLTSEDLELVEALAGYLAIALENARLYAKLQQKADAYERLKEFSENIVESIQVGVIAVNPAGEVESWNAQMEVLSARPRAQALGRAVTELLGEEFAREFRAARSSGGIYNVSKFRLPAAGQIKVVNLAVAPLVTARFERAGQIVLLSDVTAEVEMEQQLIQADRLRSVGLLAAGVAHEVNTPLAVISSYTQMLAKQTAAGDPQARVLETITRQTFRASEIISNLLNFSRTGTARFSEVELNAVVRDTLALVEHPLKSAGIHVILSLRPDAVTISGDAGKLQQVLLNLILNARDAMPRGGTLRLGTGRNEGRAWFAVSDTGEGIPEEARQRIFDPFFTTKAPARAGEGRRQGATMSTGTGLGLAVTYGIVQEHGGSIQVESSAGRGAEFRVELPLPVPAPALAQPAAV